MKSKMVLTRSIREIRLALFILPLILGATSSIAGGDDLWPTVRHYDLRIRLDPPGGFEVEGDLHLSGIKKNQFTLLLNHGLNVIAAESAPSWRPGPESASLPRVWPRSAPSTTWSTVTEPPACSRW